MKRIKRLISVLAFIACAVVLGRLTQLYFMQEGDETPKPTYIPNYQPPNSAFYVELGMPYSIRAHGSKGPDGQYIYTIETKSQALFIDACDWDTLFHE